MESEVLLLILLAVTFLLAAFILYKRKQLRLLVAVTITSMWPVICLITAISDRSSGKIPSIENWIAGFIFLFNPVAQIWYYKKIIGSLLKDKSNKGH